MYNSSEPSLCSNRAPDRGGSYTRHGGVVISLGYQSAAYEYILQDIPEAKRLIVNVAHILTAPPKDERVKGACFPDKCVVSQVRGHARFPAAVDACEQVLQTYGIVLVVCKGGNHRSPTVADSIGCRGRFVIHATIYKRPRFISKDIATLVHACVESRSGDDFYSHLIRASQNPRDETQLCVGWAPVDMDTGEAVTSVQFVRAGAEVQILQACDRVCTVKDKETKYIYTIPATWLIPKCVYMRRERY